jgi:Putative peptidoglycan binding domain/D-alanyl-D-alanine carboxypeptidase/LysM domain
MGARLPFRSDGSVTLPSALRAYENGRYPGEVLVPCGIRSFVMVEPAASAMRALVAAAAGDGITISATGTWRSYDEQKRLFESRYVTHNTGGDTKVWNGTTYWKLPKVASAATPGTSNHGKGLAADLSNSPTVPISGATLDWVANHGPSFGFWNTVRSEAWHWSYCLGDDVPGGIVVRAAPAQTASVDWAAISAMDARLSAIPFAGELTQGATGESVTAIQWKLVSFGHEVATSGEFDAQTVAAVKAFQRAQRLVDDGRVGKNTWAALGLAGAGDRPPPPPTEAPPAPDEQPVSAPTIEVVMTTYQVRPGDGFIRIAKRTLWSSSLDDAKEIAAANGLTLESSISPGQVLQIPSCRCTSVAAGDGWLAVAERLGVDADAVRGSNGWQGDVLQPGMIIYGGRSPT